MVRTLARAFAALVAPVLHPVLSELVAELNRQAEEDEQAEVVSCTSVETQREEEARPPFGFGLPLT